MTNKWVESTVEYIYTEKYLSCKFKENVNTFSNKILKFQVVLFLVFWYLVIVIIQERYHYLNK